MRRAKKRVKGAILSRERMAPFDPQENARGSAPRPRTLAVSILKSRTRCAIRCGVHGFAMNLLRVVMSCNRALLP